MDTQLFLQLVVNGIVAGSGYALLGVGFGLILGVTGTQQGVAHFAHLGGMLGGWLMIEYRRRA